MERKVKMYLTEKGFLKIKLSNGGKIKITLEVADAKGLHNYLKTIIPPQQPDQQHVNDFCILYDNNKGKSAKKSIDDFISKVYLHKNVKWIGKSTDENYSIAIDKIVSEPLIVDPNAPKFFPNAIIKGTRGPKSYVKARIEENLQLINKEDTYTMFCSVYEKREFRQKFRIDPKITGNL
ncbi:hypothetical protein [Flavobacterium sp. IMCC34518]|uniref:hypothetical protein n=1 Tax=Flavobacterium sp. IMCC34518 TaxID=3003623 RepID=UPI0022AC4EFE|nr:hypothetical protein [Flavobacterium sp. IMCC34518]